MTGSQSRGNGFLEFPRRGACGAQGRHNADFIQKRGHRRHEVRLSIDYGAFAGDSLVAVYISVHKPSPFFFILFRHGGARYLFNGAEETVRFADAYGNPQRYGLDAECFFEIGGGRIQRGKASA